MPVALLFQTVELEGLEDELEMEGAEETPSYLVNAAAAAKESKTSADSSAIEVDEFGLPKVYLTHLRSIIHEGRSGGVDSTCLTEFLEDLCDASETLRAPTNFKTTVGTIQTVGSMKRCCI